MSDTAGNQKRIIVHCWNCDRDYSWLATFSGKPRLRVACPFCRAKSVIELDPYAVPVDNILALSGADKSLTLERLNLPDVLPSAPAPDDDSDDDDSDANEEAN